MDSHRLFPCLDGYRYSGCLGQACFADRCWNGERVAHPQAGQVKADAFDRPVKVVRYTASDCPNCSHAVDLNVNRELRSAGGRSVRRWTICELGLWAGPASLYNLLNHRAPVKRVGHCPNFDDTPAEQMRPELSRKREADQARARARRALLRGMKAARQAQDLRQAP